MKRGPGAHVTARKGTYEKAEGQLEMNFSPPKKDLYAALYGAHRGQSLVSDFMLELMRVESLAAVAERYFIPREVFRSSPVQEQMTATSLQQRQEARERAQRDAERGIQRVDFRGRVYQHLTAQDRAAILTAPYGGTIQGRRVDTIVADDVFFA